MLSRLIVKSIVALALVATLFLTLAARAESTGKLSLDQIRELQGETLRNLRNPTVSNEQKLELILQQKFLAETSLRALIVDGKEDPADLAKPESNLSKAFKVADNLVFLAQLKLASNGNFTENSCIEAKGMLNISAISAEDETVQLTPDQSSLALQIDSLCKK